MRIARVRVGGRVSTAVVRGRTAHLVRGGPLGALRETGERFPLSKAQLLAPVLPGKVVAIGLNYHSHVGERTAPSNPEPRPVSKTAVVASSNVDSWTTSFETKPISRTTSITSITIQ